VPGEVVTEIEAFELLTGAKVEFTCQSATGIWLL
jgi:hypothetical protein